MTALHLLWRILTLPKLSLHSKGQRQEWFGDDSNIKTLSVTNNFIFRFLFKVFLFHLSFHSFVHISSNYSPTVPIFTNYQFFNEKKVQGIYDLLMILNGGSQYDSSHSRSVIENASKMQRGKNFLNNCKRPWKKYSICLLTKMLQKERVLNVQFIWWKEIEIHVFFSCFVANKKFAQYNVNCIQRKGYF